MSELKVQSIADVITNSSSEIFIIQDPKNLEGTLESYGGFLYDIEEYCNMYIECQKAKNSDGVCWYGDSWEDCFEESIADNKQYDSDYEYGYNAGDLLIESTGDNSIPWEVMDHIEESARKHGYVCKRRHLG